MNEIGFIGLGVMGLPMARNLAAAGARLRVWNRSSEKYRALEASNVAPAATAGEVLRAVEVTIIMLVNSEAIDEVLGRGTGDFARNLRGRTIVSMSSVSPDYSCALARDIGDAGGHYVEAPVSGSRKPAEDAQLVCMAGGDPADIARVSPMLRHMCREVIDCGPVGNALRMKLAVNLYLNTMLAGLAEAVHFASENGLPLEKFKQAIDAGPLASDVTRVKLPKLIQRDFSVQAAVSDAFASTRLIADAARKAAMATPLLDLSSTLYGRAVELGDPRADMASVVRAIEADTARIRGASAQQRPNGAITPTSGAST